MLRNITMVWLSAFLGLTPVAVLANELPPSVAAAAATLRNLGYDDVAVSFRVFGGYVLQGKMGGDFAMVALSADGRTLERIELFHDLDANGVFGQDETLGSNETAPVEAMIWAALNDPSSIEVPVESDTRPEVGPNDLYIPGFAQKSQVSVARNSLQANAYETLGFGTPAVFESRTETSIETLGQQDYGVKVDQVTSLPGLRVEDKVTVTSQPRRSTASFTEPDVDAIQDSIVNATPDAVALKDSIMSKVPTSEDILLAIVAPP